MLLVIPVPFLKKENQLFVESQACNGLDRWADNFDSVIVAAPTIPEELAQERKTMTWCDTSNLVNLNQLELIPLPWAYSIPKFIYCYTSVRSLLGKLIALSDYLQFGIGGLWGDWAAVAALEAHKQGRGYAIHTDRVQYNVVIESSKESNLKNKIKARVVAFLMEKYHQSIIKNCALGLWHGQDCYSAYRSFCKNSYLIHNIHLKPKDGISEIEIAEKIKNTKNDSKLRICYAGRIVPMKAPLDWVKAIGRAKEQGVDLQATWLGDGILFNEMQEMIKKLGLNSCIELAGFESNRDNLLDKIKKSHIMLFTHITKESPRCLIESLICGTPIIGYESEYAKDLVKEFGGGIFVQMKDWRQLGDLLLSLWENKEQLSQLIQEAGNNGKRFNDKAVFFERSNLIKQHL